jgi:hypothetical protein
MADYYPLIARAIAGLDANATGEARRALYERARTALIAQLRGVEPPLSESEITRERLALEEAVRKVESEAAHRARSPQSAPPPSPPAAQPQIPPMPETLQARPRAGDAFRAAPRGPRTEPSAPRPPRDRPPGAAREARPPLGQDDRQRSSRPEPPRPDAQRPQRPQPPGDPRARGNRPGLENFRDVIADADDLGGAAAKANRAARKAYSNVPSPSPEFDRIEPDLENRGGPQTPYNYDDEMQEAGRYQGQPPQQQQGSSSRPQPKPPKPKRAGPRFPIKSMLLVGLALVIVGAAIWQGPKVVRFVRGILKPAPSAVVEAPKDPNAPAAPRPKIPDRVGQPGAGQIAPIAQKVVLYDEDPAEPQGKQYVGTVIWRTEQVKGAGNAPADLAVRADVDIPDRKFKMTLTIRRNSDASLPASHTAELTFTLPQDFQGGGVANVPGVLMKSNEQARGTPLAGLAVKVTDGFFLVGLSNVEADRARNIQLLKERSWFDVPLVYTNQRRAIVAIEKGAPGERAFNEAFAAWGQ